MVPEAGPVTTIVPGWAGNWRANLVDEIARDHLTWFLHDARQYVHRSHVAKVLMAAWDRDWRVLHPFGSAGMSCHNGPLGPAPSMRAMLDEAEAEARRAWAMDN